MREKLRSWVTPPDPSTNHNIACDIHHEGTAEWFFRGNVFAEWKSTGSLLWIYGKRMLFPLLPDRPLDLIIVCILRWLRQEHPLVRHLASLHEPLMNTCYSLALQSSKTLSLYARQGRPLWRTFILTSDTLINNTVATRSRLSSSSFLLSLVLVVISLPAFILNTTMVHKSPAIVL